MLCAEEWPAVIVVVPEPEPHGAVAAAHLTSGGGEATQGPGAASAAAPGRKPGKVAVNCVDKFLTGLLQCVNVLAGTMCLHLPLFPPAGVIEKTIATASARFIQIA